MEILSQRLAAAILHLSLTLALALVAGILLSGDAIRSDALDSRRALPVADRAGDPGLPVLESLRPKLPAAHPPDGGAGGRRTGQRAISDAVPDRRPERRSGAATARAARVACLSFTTALRARLAGRLGAPSTAPPHV